MSIETGKPTPEKRKQLLKLKREIKIPVVDGYSQTEDGYLCDVLNKRKLLKPHYLYAAFNPSLLDAVLTTGTFHAAAPDKMYCCSYNDTSGEPVIVDSRGDALVYQIENASSPAERFAYIVVYDGTQLSHIYLSEYRFNHPDNKLAAVKGVIKVTLADYKV